MVFTVAPDPLPVTPGLPDFTSYGVLGAVVTVLLIAVVVQWRQIRAAEAAKDALATKMIDRFVALTERVGSGLDTITGALAALAESGKRNAEAFDRNNEIIRQATTTIAVTEQRAQNAEHDAMVQRQRAEDAERRAGTNERRNR